jgi:hypothetical protein
MKRKTLPKLVKKAERRALKLRATKKPPTDPIRWSTAVRSWVVEFQNQDRDESLRTFDSLFKPEFSEEGSAE